MDTKTLECKPATVPEAKPRWVPILMYHRVIPTRDAVTDPYHLSVSVAEFETHIKYLKDHGYHCLPLDRGAVAGLCSKGPVRKEVIITFDDGYRDVFVHAFPVLKKFGFTATVFLVSSFLGYSNIWDKGKVNGVALTSLKELEEMKEYGLCFGSHSATHVDMTRMDKAALWREIAGSKAALEDALNVDVYSFSFPFGLSNGTVRESVEEAGYVAACGIEQREHDIYNLSRIDMGRCGGSWLQWHYRFSGAHFYLRTNPALRSLKGLFDAGNNSAKKREGPVRETR